MDAWNAAQSWAIFSVAAVGLGVYYFASSKSSDTTKRPVQSKSSNTTSEPQVGKPRNEKRSKARKAKAPTAKAAEQSSSVEAKEQASPVTEKAKSTKDEDASDKDFARKLMEAQKGINMNTSSKNTQRIKTVKTKSSATPLLPSSDSQADDGDWSPVTVTSPKQTGVEDMLEETAPGPSSLRITAPAQPAQEKTVRQPKKEVVETKKQRQNRQKIEEKRLQREAEEKERKALEERTRRTAREARGEPAKNGIPIAPAPKDSPWVGQTAPAAQPAAEATNHTSPPLLDTFDAESTSSSNDAQMSTAATSTTDGAPAQWSDEPVDERFAQTITDSEPWNEVKKKSKKGKNDTSGDLTPVGGAPVAATASSNSKQKKFNPSNKTNGFLALGDGGADA